MTIEEMIDLQEAGSKARAMGLAVHENPHLAPDRMPTGDSSCLGDWLARHDAWRFGWEAENASYEGRITAHFEKLISSSS